MSLDYQNDIDKDIGLSENYSDIKSGFFGGRLLKESAHTTTIDHDDVTLTLPPKRNSSLDALSEELERRTRETQKLQEEVEHATKLTMERIGRTFTNTTGTSVNPMPTSVDGSPDERTDYHSSRRQSVIQSVSYEVDVEVARCMGFPGKDVLEKAMEEYSQQVWELQKQLRETHDLHEKQKFSFRQSIIKLQTKLQESQIERDALADLRMKESRKQSDLMGKLQGTILELQAMKQAGEQRLLEAEDKAKFLSRRAEAVEQALRDVWARLEGCGRHSGRSHCVGYEGPTSPSQVGTAVGSILQDLENENGGLRERLLLVEGQLETLEKEGQGKTELLMKEQRQRMEQLITSHDQEVAMLMEKLSSCRSNAASMRVQVELLQKQAESQTSVHQSQMSELESTLSVLRSDLLEAQQTHEAKMAALERELAQAQAQAEEAQRRRDGSIQQAEELDAQLCQLTMELRVAREELALEREQNQQLWDRDTGRGVAIDDLRHQLDERSRGMQQLEALIGSLKEECHTHLEVQLSAEKEQREVQEELACLRGELQLTRDQLEQARDGATRLREERAEEAKRQQALLEERDGELQLQQQEAQQGRVRLEEAQGRSHALRAEVEVLRLKLEEREKAADVLRRQLESAAVMATQHGRSTDAMQEERNRLANHLNQLSLDNHQLKAAVEQRDHRLGAVAREKAQQQAVLSERSRGVKALTLEKQQMTAELEVQRMELLRLTEEQEALRQLHSAKTEELEGANAKLKAQLVSARADLDQAKSTLRTLEGADGHGLKVAVGMQRQITAKREQIDFLQGRMELLEENTEKLTQEKRYQAVESRRQAQELASVREERRQLGAEVEALRGHERQLKGKVEKLETALHKMSDSFVDCQDFLQKQEQEFVRLKLQHALDVKELQGQNLRATGNVLRSPITSPTLPAQPPFSQPNSHGLIELKPSALRTNPTLELRSLVQELRSVIDADHGPHTGTRRRSAPEKARGTRAHEVTKDTMSARRVTIQSNGLSELSPLRTTDLDGRDLNSTFSAKNDGVGLAAARPCYTSSPHVSAPGRRSPVHSLLTSALPTPAHARQKAEAPLTDVHSLANQQAELTGQTCKELQGKLDSLQNLVDNLQMKNHEMSSMIKGQEKRMRREEHF